MYHTCKLSSNIIQFGIFRTAKTFPAFKILCKVPSPRCKKFNVQWSTYFWSNLTDRFIQSYWINECYECWATYTELNTYFLNKLANCACLGWQAWPRGKTFGKKNMAWAADCWMVFVHSKKLLWQPKASAHNPDVDNMYILDRTIIPEHFDRWSIMLFNTRQYFSLELTILPLNATTNRDCSTAASW